MYLVKDPVQGVMSYIFYADDFSGCINQNDKQQRHIWANMQSSLNFYFALAQKIPQSSIQKFAYAARLAGNFHDESKALLGWQLQKLLPVLYSCLSANKINKKEAISLVDGFLSAIVKGNWQILNMIPELTDKGPLTRVTFITLAKSLARLSKKLTADQFTALSFLYEHNEIKAVANVVKGLEKLTSRYSGGELYRRVYKLFGGIRGFLPNRLPKYAKLIRLESRIKPRDIAAAERSIGAKGALQIWKKFKVAHFDRYHASILKHVLKLAINPKYERDKPLVFIITARKDSNGAFYWNRRFKHDKRVRVVVVETNDYDDLKRMAWSVRNEYGIPDSVLITAHGDTTGISFGSKTRITAKGYAVNFTGIKLKDYNKLKKDFKGYFGGKRGYMVVDACYAGARLKGNGMNVGQMFANAFNAEARAARDVETLSSITVVFDKHGRAILKPTFFEMGWPHFGFNQGGSVFYPGAKRVPESVYNGAADTNTGWRVGAGFSLAGRDPSIDIFLGGSYAFLHRLRFRADIGAHFNPISRAISASFDPEIAVGITNQLLLFGGGRFGATMTRGNDIRPLYQANFGAKILIPFLNGELDIGGASVNGGKPKFFLSFQGRF